MIDNGTGPGPALLETTECGGAMQRCARWSAVPGISGCCFGGARDSGWLVGTSAQLFLVLTAIAGLTGVATAASPTISEFAIPTANSGLAGITAGPDGNVWFTEVNSNQIG